VTAAGFPVLTPGRHPADEPFAVADWRRRVAEIYADVRRVSVDDPSSAHALWVQRRDVLLAEHPASPLDADAKAAFEGLDVPHYDPAYRFECEIRPTTPQRLDVSSGTDGVVPFERLAEVEVGDLGTLAVWRLRGYAGGLFVPVKDASADTYGGGRYLLDTIKGADLGMAAGRLVVDLNFAYNPSCAYDPAWTCPLATRANPLGVEVPVGERVFP
jgi:uncharacterized protein (DUF1684 family)